MFVSDSEMVLGVAAARGNADSESDERQTRYNENHFRLLLQTIINTFYIYTYHILYHKYTSKLLPLLRRLSLCLEMSVFVITLY